MHLPSSIKETLKQSLGVEIKSFHPASGGCINNGGEAVTSRGSYFIKWNDAGRYPLMFETEAKGLRLLASAKCIDVPGVIQVEEAEGMQIIVMKFIRGAHRHKNYWTWLGEQLAALHKNTSEYFGLDHDNYIGSLPQHNAHRESWIDFFIHQRLEVQLKLADEQHRVDREVRKQFEELYEKLPDLLPDERPSLLHGDLWGGNLMVNEEGKPCLIDPAVYYGHREAELAFTQLFGGFENEFYRSYNQAFPLQPGLEERAGIYNLYPLLVHVNLFGGGYLSQVRHILQKVL